MPEESRAHHAGGGGTNAVQAKKYISNASRRRKPAIAALQSPFDMQQLVSAMWQPLNVIWQTTIAM